MNKATISSQLQYLIYFHLKKNKKSKRHFKIDISNSFFFYLKNELNINGRFKECPELISEFDLPRFRKINDNLFTKTSNLQIRIANGRNLDSFKSLPRLVVRFHVVNAAM